MSAGNHPSDKTAYRPTSLEFINHPNPIEPHAQSQKHPLDKTPRIESTRIDAVPSTSSSQSDLFSLILEPCEKRPAKRHKVADNVLDLPRLPVRSQAKRLRIPPTLSGLHQPPPDAGLLPSINVENPRAQSHASSQPLRQKENVPAAARPEKAVDLKEQISATVSRKESDVPKGSSTLSKKKILKRNPWTEQETEDLLKGVAKFGIGQWTKILKCADFHFTRRTALDLKDRFRVYCPDDYRNGRSQGAGGSVAADDVVTEKNSPDGSSLTAKSTKKTAKKPPVPAKGVIPHRVTKSKLISLGIERPFAKAARRSRHGYTPEEDDAILKGFKKYGNSWARIRSDPSLGLSKRKATDLRDRFRTRFPAEYAKAGLAPRPDKSLGASRGGDVLSSAGKQIEKTSDQQAPREDPPQSTNPPSSTPSTEAHNPPAMATSATQSTTPHTRRPQQPSLFTLDDIFLGAPSSFNYDYDYTEPDASSSPIILDRGILDWATADAARTNAANTTTAANNAEAAAREAVTNSGGIDPLMTLVLPRPAGFSMSGGGGAGAGATPIPQTGHGNNNSTTITNGNASNSLPSLADLLPMDSAGGNSASEQLELPSLMQWYTGALVEERGSGAVGGGNLTLEELLS